MAESRSNKPAVRVVVLSADAPGGAFPAQAPATVECIRVQSAYEAAAEMIAAPTMAVVIDLRLMNPRHLRLLQIARERGVEMLAVGGIPSGLTAEDLSGVRLTARADLKAVLDGLLAEQTARASLAPLEEGQYVAEGPPRPAEREPAPSAPAADAGGPPAPRRPAASPAEPAEAAGERTAAPTSAATPRPPPGAPAAPAEKAPFPAPQARSPRTVLTPDELAALMEDEP
jgi:hypothetical protein